MNTSSIDMNIEEDDEIDVDISIEIDNIQDLSQRGLLISSKWSAEQLNGLSLKYKQVDVNTATLSQCKDILASSMPSLGSDEYLKYTLAKSYFDLKEYKRCTDVLLDCTSQLNIFLRSYSKYLSIEKRHQEELAEGIYEQQQLQQQQQQQQQQNNTDAQQQHQQHLQQQQQQNSGNKLNRNYSLELQKLQQYFMKMYNNQQQQQQSMDGLCLYLYGIILKKLNHVQQSRNILIESVTKYPCNWSAWSDLATLCSDIDDVNSLQLPNHFMKDFFLAHVKLELQQNNESLSIYQNLSRSFSKSTYILAQTAIGNYNLRTYDVGEELFEKLIEIEPNRLENIDIYSNILYVRDKKAQLSMLAHRALTIEKFCPETCCIIGNYYSIKSEHEKAILYFQRALKLNDRYLEAWTLIGHEFLEIKNVSAAIHAYRRAVDINPKDYRAWYGLGQTYQLLKLPLYSLYYFQKATTIRPYDPRMWCAAGTCYEFMDRIPEAIRCYERAEENYDHERVALSKLAKLYQEMQNHDKAAYYYKKNLYHCDTDKIESQDTIDALLFLANNCKNIGLLVEAEKYCLRLLDYAGPEKEEAKALLREIHNSNNNNNK
eukprot:gene3667-4566_t